jgi:putative membrane-bound dehydrogenase-like protein
MRVTLPRCLAQEDGFRPLFDGRSLENWDGNPDFWSVRDGVITGQTTADKPTRGNTFLIYRGFEVGDFELRLQFRIVGGNSGIQYRSKEMKDAGRWVVGGYQADFEAGTTFSGILYEERGRGILAQRGQMTVVEPTGDGKFRVNVIGSIGDSNDIQKVIKNEAWNDYTILARGNHFTHIINGRVTVDVTDNDAAHAVSQGILALQLHAGPPMTVQFKEIRIKQLPGGADQARLPGDANPPRKKVVFVAGKPSHGYGAHEHNAGCILLAKELERAMPGYDCQVYQNGWPAEGLAAFQGADTVVVYCDGGGGHLLNAHLDEFNQVMDKGVGLVCLHYAVEVPQGKSGDAFLNWLGGYFEMNWSVNPHWTAKFDRFPDHPVARGVEPFEINDEWYFHMRFREQLKGVTPILSAVPPAATMSRADGTHSGNPAVRRAVAAGEPQHVAWVAERPNGGRGFGFTGGHVHWNWGDPDFRKVVLNGIVWTAKGEVPAGGVDSANPNRAELEANQDFPKPSSDKNDAAKDDSHDAARAVANLDVNPLLRASLFAAEPLLLSPANIDIDHRGRVWVCEIVNYRGHRNERPAGDRILILEDTDGDGRADKTKVFYQGTDIDSPHGICVLGNKAIVSASSKVMLLTDTDGDDQADEKKDLFTGISGVQHDHGIHAFTFGPDGKLYFNFGNEGRQLLDAQGRPVVDKAGNIVAAARKPYQEGMVFRCNTDLSDFETLGWNFRNNWMVTVDSFGTLWQSDNDDDGNRGVRINYVMEFGNYGYKDEFTGEAWPASRTNIEPALPERHWHLNDPGVVPNLLHTGAGSPTGITVYEGSLLPETFRGQLLHCDAGPSITRSYVVRKEGAGYQAEIVNILEGTRDQWFRPSDVKIAPDGSLIVADWYDPGVGGHAMGDVDRGRLFRVYPQGHDGRYRIPRFDFGTAAGAVQALRNPNYAVRYLAWTALHELGAGAEAELQELWQDPDPRMRARALWLLGKIPGRGQHYVELAIQDAHPDIRITGLRLARQLKDVDTLAVVAKLVHDAAPEVRRECAIALRRQQDGRVPGLWARLAAQYDGQDRWYLEALGIAADQQWDACLEAWLSEVGGQWNDARGRGIVWRSRAERTPQLLASLITDPQTPVAELPRYFRALDFLSGPNRDRAIAEIVFSKSTPEDNARTQLIATEATRRLPTDVVPQDPRLRQSLERTLDSLVGTSDFVDLVGRFRVTGRYGELLTMAEKDPEGQVGVSAVRTLLASGQDGPIRQAIASSSPETQAALLMALGNSSDNRAVEILRDVTTADANNIELRRDAVRALSRIRSGAGWLMRQAENNRVEEELHQAVAAALTTARWGDVRTKAAELFPVPASKSEEKLLPIDELARLPGDSGRGKALFAGTATCAKCHVVQGQGKSVGPDLSEIGGKLSREAMFESILFPSAGISHNYETFVLATTDGNIVTGLLASKSENEVAITSEDGITRTFKMSDVDQLQKQTVSLMPADLQKLVTQQELVDVVQYLLTLRK